MNLLNLFLGIVISYEVRYYIPNSTVPFITEQIIGFTCNQDQPTNIRNVNPLTLVWDDPNITGRTCRYTDPNLKKLAIGNYELTLIAFNEFGESPESERVQFCVRNGNPSRCR